MATATSIISQEEVSSGRFSRIGYGTARHPPAVRRRLRIVNASAWMAAAFTGTFGAASLLMAEGRGWIVGVAYLIAAVLLAAIPLLHRFGSMVGPIAFGVVGYAVIFIICSLVGTDTGMPMQYLVAATIMALMLGRDHVAISVAFAVLAAALIVILEMTVPADTAIQPRTHTLAGLIATVTGSAAIQLAIILYAVREAARAEDCAERELQRSEALLANIMPPEIAWRLKSRPQDLLIDRYEQASVLFADMAGFTARAGETPPEILATCLDRVFSAFDGLVERHGLEKIKTSGDAYLVVSGIPKKRPNHAEALADFALALRDVAATLPNSQGQPTSIRIGMASGPVAAGVIGRRKMAYDVWGDTVNVASRMETTGQEGQIQVAPDMFELLKDKFVLDPLGSVNVKGKGLMNTWVLRQRRQAVDPASPDPPIGATHASHDPERDRPAAAADRAATSDAWPG